jgi:hypothetical protein
MTDGDASFEFAYMFIIPPANFFSGFRYTSTLRPVSVYRIKATHFGTLGITSAYCQPYC